MSGNALVGQSGGPTSVINASLLGVVDAARGFREIKKVYGMRFGIEGFLDGNIIDFDSVTQDQLDLFRSTPSSILGSCRYKVQDKDLPRILEILRTHDIRYYFMIGGNDTMDTIHRIETYCREADYDLVGIGIPKTVDNDLFGTDHTPGYPSASRYVALSVQQSSRLAQDMQRVDGFVVHQTVGRDAGWLAASAALARGGEGDAPHLLLLPERPVRPEDFVRRVREVAKSNGWVYIVVGEGALWADGTPISASTTKDGFANLEFGAMGGSSAALSLHSLISKETGLRGEFQITESLSMCAADRVSAVDVEEAYMCGRCAVDNAMSGISGVMVTIERIDSDPYRADFGSVPLVSVAEKTKPMPDELISACGFDVTDAFLSYLRPLVGALPVFAKL